MIQNKHKLNNLLSWGMVKGYADDIFSEYEFEIYWVQSAWDFLLKNFSKVENVKPNNQNTESILWLFALYEVLFYFEKSNEMYNSNLEDVLDDKILEWNIEKDLLSYYNQTDKKEVYDKAYEDCYKRARKYEKIIKKHFNDNWEKIIDFFDGTYYIENYTDYDKTKSNDEEYDDQYDKYRCPMTRDICKLNFMGNFTHGK